MTLQIDTFLPYMRDVTRCEHALQELNLIWRMIESSAKMNCPEEARAILPAMASTRQGFNRLEQDLVNSLVSEKVSNVLTELGTKAQYVIDIVVRNLYERTADVGFLSTDNELCSFVAGLTSDTEEIRQRLNAYRNKYTVYDEIILLDAAGNVLVQIDDTTPLEGSTDPLIDQTLNSSGYVETFRYCDLRPSKRRALIYSQRMLHPVTSQVVGVLCLCFHFEHEMQSIFSTHSDPDGRSVMLLLDESCKVIESSDKHWVPLGSQVPVNPTNSPTLLRFAGREYLVRTFTAQGYQGYPGPQGWLGQVMVPVDLAFTGRRSGALEAMEQSIRSGVLSHAQSFSPPLFEIIKAAETIRRVVWNGQVMAAGQEGDLQMLKAVLTQISEAAVRSNELFENSISDLYETVLTSGLRNAEFVSHLLVDLLDRNLYERADDCRWWALTPELRGALQDDQHMVGEGNQTTEILRYINSLYTVYTRIFVYDASGTVVASTLKGQEDTHGMGFQIDAGTLEAVLSLASEQSYFVSAFESSALYEDEPTYIYHAAIRSLKDDKKIVGGIGIVFNSKDELKAMLQGGVGNQEGMNAFYTNRSGKIISSTDATRAEGSVLELSSDLKLLAKGQSISKVVIHDGQYAILGCTASAGYREFKVSDGYQEDVLAIVFQPLGAVRTVVKSASISEAIYEQIQSSAAGEEFATFVSAGTIFALPAAHALEAIPATRMASTPSGRDKARIGLIDIQNQSGQASSIWVYDWNLVLGKDASSTQVSNQIVVLKNEERSIGLLVDDIHDVKEFEPSQIVKSPFDKGDGKSLLHRLIRANKGELLIQAVNVEGLFSSI